MKKTTLIVIALCLTGFIFAQDKMETQVNEFIDSWHKAASDSDLEGYFEKIDDHGIYIGTDSSELWSRQEFYEWSIPHFEKKKGWSFKAIERNVYFSVDGNMAWFDEQLQYSKGTLRGSGVLIKRETDWRIMHYVLSLPVPNDKFKEVLDVIHSKSILSEDEK